MEEVEKSEHKPSDDLIDSYNNNIDSLQ